MLTVPEIEGCTRGSRSLRLILLRHLRSGTDISWHARRVSISSHTRHRGLPFSVTPHHSDRVPTTGSAWSTVRRDVQGVENLSDTRSPCQDGTSKFVRRPSESRRRCRVASVGGFVVLQYTSIHESATHARKPSASPCRDARTRSVPHMPTSAAYRRLSEFAYVIHCKGYIKNINDLGISGSDE